MKNITTYRSNLSQKIAAFITLLIGFISVFEGTKVILGIDTKNYNVITWLVLYNIVLGVFSIAIAFFIWRKSNYANRLVLFVLAMHFFIFLYLKLVSTIVASESINAMLFRVCVWILIATLSIIIPNYFNKKQS